MNENRDIFKNWEKNATIRSTPIRNVESLDNSRFFSASVSPLLDLGFFKELNFEEQRAIEIQLLYRYLEFTEYLETKLVNPQILKIADDQFGLGLSKKVKINAYKIYCDEAFHALQACNMSDQVNEITGVSSIGFNIDLNKQLEALKDAASKEIQEYFYLFFVAVSECLVSQELRGYIRDESIHSDIFALMRDHARDEAVHALFFVEILEILYRKLGEKTFLEFVEIIPAMLRIYLIPEAEVIQRIMNESTIDDHRITTELINDIYSDGFIQNSGAFLYDHVDRILKNN